ncbi:hypothetical protein HAX54_011755, partial [Datura stramonium]|nr:hypothetical protein [Datura stramonium]
MDSIIADSQPLWVVMEGDISHQDLKFEVRMWLDLSLLACCTSGPDALISNHWKKCGEQRESLICPQRGT